MLFGHIGCSLYKPIETAKFEILVNIFIQICIKIDKQIDVVARLNCVEFCSKNKTKKNWVKNATVKFARQQIERVVS